MSNYEMIQNIYENKWRKDFYVALFDKNNFVITENVGGKCQK
jgi:hypothetical protein